MKCKAFCVGVFFTGAVAFPVVADFPRPTGIYLVGSHGATQPPMQVMQKPFVDGYQMITSWRILEPAPGAFDFSSIDSVIADLESAGKKLTLVVFPHRMPQHLLDQPGVEAYCALSNNPSDVCPLSGQTGELETAVTWDETTLASWEVFAQQLGDHDVWDAQQASLVDLRDHSVLMQVACLIVGLGDFRDKGMRLVSRPSYDRNLFTASFVRSVNAMEDQFPGKFPFTFFFLMNDDISSPGLTQHVLDVARSEWFDGTTIPRLGLFQENLACSTPTPGLVGFPLFEEQDNTYTMFQMLQPWVAPFTEMFADNTDACLVTTVPGDRSTAISGPEVGLQHGFDTFHCRYFEIHLADLRHQGFADEFQIWHEILTSSVPGDFDGDGDVDLDDFAVFQMCFTATNGGPVDAGCEPGDSDGDGDIDCDDWAAFVLAFTGPGSLPEFEP